MRKRLSGSGAGSVYRQGVKGPGGRRIAADYELTTYEPNRRLAFRTIAGPVRPTGEFRFDEVDGGTRLKNSAIHPCIVCFTDRSEIHLLPEINLTHTTPTGLETAIPVR